MTTFTDTQTQLTAHDLDEIEHQFGFVFPLSVRSHYLVYNGGQPTNDRYVFADGMYIIHEFIPMKYGPSRLTLEATLLRLKYGQHVLPDHIIPIAVDPGGNYYCFSALPADGENIYYYDTEGRSSVDSQPVFLAPSLSFLLLNLVTKAEAYKQLGIPVTP